MLKLFQVCRNIYHHSISDLIASFSLVTKCILHSLASVEYTFVTKALPEWKTFVAWWRVTRICLLAFHLGSHVVKGCLILAGLSASKLYFLGKTMALKGPLIFQLQVEHLIRHIRMLILC